MTNLVREREKERERERERERKRKRKREREREREKERERERERERESNNYLSLSLPCILVYFLCFALVPLFIKCFYSRFLFSSSYFTLLSLLVPSFLQTPSLHFISPSFTLFHLLLYLFPLNFILFDFYLFF